MWGGQGHHAHSGHPHTPLLRARRWGEPRLPVGIATPTHVSPIISYAWRGGGAAGTVGRWVADDGLPPNSTCTPPRELAGMGGRAGARSHFRTHSRHAAYPPGSHAVAPQVPNSRINCRGRESTYAGFNFWASEEHLSAAYISLRARNLNVRCGHTTYDVSVFGDRMVTRYVVGATFRQGQHRACRGKVSYVAT